MTGLTGSPFIGVIARARTRVGYVHNGKTRQTRHVEVCKPAARPVVHH
jgi:hypothetical protein